MHVIQCRYNMWRKQEWQVCNSKFRIGGNSFLLKCHGQSWRWAERWLYQLTLARPAVFASRRNVHRPFVVDLNRRFTHNAVLDYACY